MNDDSILVAYCGLECSTCPIRLATLEEDISAQAEIRNQIAHELTKIYGTVPKPWIITDCDGCKAIQGRLFTGCEDCTIRNCAIEKGLVNCAYCNDYPCDKLMKHYAIDPGSKIRLDGIRRLAEAHD
jgi:hypothetical protein